MAGRGLRPADGKSNLLILDHAGSTWEHGLISDWINGSSADAREEAWRQMQVVLHLKFTLRDAAAMKRLTTRAQERRVYQA